MTFFGVSTLKFWSARLQELPEAFLAEEGLPGMDDDWVDLMISCSEVCQMAQSYSSEKDINRVAAHLFYKIVKNHYLVDGNKRSAVVCTYLFLLLNEKRLTVPEGDLLAFAKNMASSGEPESVCVNAAALFLEDYTEQI